MVKHVNFWKRATAVEAILSVENEVAKRATACKYK
jgi:hypothetical protein